MFGTNNVGVIEEGSGITAGNTYVTTDSFARDDVFCVFGEKSGYVGVASVDDFVG